MPTDEEYKRRRILGLIISILLTGIGLSQFSNIWISKSDLLQVKGTLKHASIDISMVVSKSRRPPHKETVSQKAELIFFLNESDQRYRLAKNIGDHQFDDQYEAILKGLRATESVSVWIMKKESYYLRPQVFQIDNDERTLLAFKHLHFENHPITLLLIVVGLSFSILLTVALLQTEFRTASADRSKSYSNENVTDFHN